MGSYHLIHIWAILAVAASGLSAGAALYMAFIEHPARMACPTPEAFAQWKAGYRRGAWMQGGLGIAGIVFSILTWRGDGGLLFLGAAAPLIGLVAISLRGLIPSKQTIQTVNGTVPYERLLLAENLDPASDRARGLLVKWGWQQAFVCIFPVAAFGTMLVQGLWFWGL